MSTNDIPPLLLNELLRRAEYLIARGYVPHANVMSLAEELYINMKNLKKVDIETTFSHK
jgi:hypothetical protein